MQGVGCLDTCLTVLLCFQIFDIANLRSVMMVLFTIFSGCNLWMENDREAHVNTMDLGIFMKSALSLYVGLDQG